MAVDHALPDGSFLSRIRVGGATAERKESSPVRVIEYRIEGVDRSQETTIRLITTLLDPQEFPAEELATLYQQRWEIETAFDELKTHLMN
jgi:IS4 transposase